MESSSCLNNCCFNVAEQAAIQSSLLQIKLNENFNSTNLWGKILGLENDYIIVVATKINYQIEEKFFFSIDNGLSFAQMPIVEPWMQPKCMKIASVFTGNPSYIYEEKKQSNEEEENEEEKDEKEQNEENENNGDEPPPVEHPLTELDRLTWTVSKINEECLIVPKGSMILTSKKIMQKNNNFNGLSRNNANQIEFYQHLRAPKDPYAISKYRKAAAMNNTEFLDPITSDLPNGCWKLRSNKNGLEVIIKNLLWPGYEFQYKVGEKNFIQGYCGNGVRQNDLLFLF